MDLTRIIVRSLEGRMTYRTLSRIPSLKATLELFNRKGNYRTGSSMVHACRLQ